MRVARPRAPGTDDDPGMTETLAGSLVRGLAEYGTDRVFAVPGVHNTELFREFARAGISVVLPRHEQGAGFMADGYARSSGRPGVCAVVSGPGLTNLLTAFGEAHSDSVPILAISTVLSRRDVGKGRGESHDMADQSGAVRSFGARSFTIEEADEIPELLARAFAAFRAERPRPVHLQVAFDRLRSPGTEAPIACPIPAPPVPPEDALNAAVSAIERAERPVVVAGGGAADSRIAMLQFRSKTAAPFATTVAGKGILDETHPLSLGCALPRPALRETLLAGDLAIAVGSELAHTDFGPGSLPFAGETIRIDIDAQALATNFRADLPLLGDAGATIALLAERVSARGAGPPSGAVAEARASSVRDAHGERPGMEGVLDALRRALPEDAIVAADMTEIAYLANEAFPVHEPRSWLHPMGFGTLGYALPAAIGARLACPRRPVAALIGDYGIQYSLAELGTACEQRLPIPVLVWNNRKLHAIEKDMIRRQMDPIAVLPLAPDFRRLAHGFGARAARPDTLAEVEASVARALRARGPTVIELRPERFGD